MKSMLKRKALKIGLGGVLALSFCASIIPSTKSEAMKKGSSGSNSPSSPSRPTNKGPDVVSFGYTTTDNGGGGKILTLTGGPSGGTGTANNPGSPTVSGTGGGSSLNVGGTGSNNSGLGTGSSVGATGGSSSGPSVRPKEGANHQPVNLGGSGSTNSPSSSTNSPKKGILKTGNDGNSGTKKHVRFADDGVSGGGSGSQDPLKLPFDTQDGNTGGFGTPGDDLGPLLDSDIFDTLSLYLQVKNNGEGYPGLFDDMFGGSGIDPSKLDDILSSLDLT